MRLQSSIVYYRRQIKLGNLQTETSEHISCQQNRFEAFKQFLAMSFSVELVANIEAKAQVKMNYEPPVRLGEQQTSKNLINFYKSIDTFEAKIKEEEIVKDREWRDMTLAGKRTLSNRISQLKAQLKDKKIIAQSWEDKESINGEITEFLNIAEEELDLSQKDQVIKNFLQSEDTDFNKAMLKYFRLADDQTEEKEESMEQIIKDESSDDEIKQEVVSRSSEQEMQQAEELKLTKLDSDRHPKVCERWTCDDYQVLIDAIQTHGLDTERLVRSVPTKQRLQIQNKLYQVRKRDDSTEQVIQKLQQAIQRLQTGNCELENQKDRLYNLQQELNHGNLSVDDFKSKQSKVKYLSRCIRKKEAYQSYDESLNQVEKRIEQVRGIILENLPIEFHNQISDKLMIYDQLKVENDSQTDEFIQQTNTKIEEILKECSNCKDHTEKQRSMKKVYDLKKKVKQKEQDLKTQARFDILQVNNDWLITIIDQHSDKINKESLLSSIYKFSGFKTPMIDPKEAIRSFIGLKKQVDLRTNWCNMDFLKEEKNDGADAVKGEKIFEVVKFDGSFDVFIRATEETETAWAQKELSILAQTLKTDGLNVQKLSRRIPTKTHRQIQAKLGKIKTKSNSNEQLAEGVKHLIQQQDQKQEDLIQRLKDYQEEQLYNEEVFSKETHRKYNIICRDLSIRTNTKKDQNFNAEIFYKLYDKFESFLGQLREVLDYWKLSSMMARARDVYEAQERVPFDESEIHLLEQEIDILRSCKQTHGTNRQITNKINRLRFKIKVRQEKRNQEARVQNLIDSVNVFVCVLQEELTEDESQVLLSTCGIEKTEESLYTTIYNFLDLDSAFTALLAAQTEQKKDPVLGRKKYERSDTKYRKTPQQKLDHWLEKMEWIKQTIELSGKSMPIEEMKKLRYQIYTLQRNIDQKRKVIKNIGYMENIKAKFQEFKKLLEQSIPSESFNRIESMAQSVTVDYKTDERLEIKIAKFQSNLDDLQRQKDEAYDLMTNQEKQLLSAKISNNKLRLRDAYEMAQLHEKVKITQSTILNFLSVLEDELQHDQGKKRALLEQVQSQQDCIQLEGDFKTALEHFIGLQNQPDMIKEVRRSYGSHHALIQQIKMQQKIEDPRQASLKYIPHCSWTADETLGLINGLQQHGEDLIKLSEFVTSKTIPQIKNKIENSKYRKRENQTVIDFIQMKYQNSLLNQSCRTNEHPHSVYLGDLKDRFELLKSLCEKEIDPETYSDIVKKVDEFEPKPFQSEASKKYYQMAEIKILTLRQAIDTHTLTKAEVTKLGARISAKRYNIRERQERDKIESDINKHQQLVLEYTRHIRLALSEETKKQLVSTLFEIDRETIHDPTTSADAFDQKGTEVCSFMEQIKDFMGFGESDLKLLAVSDNPYFRSKKPLNPGDEILQLQAKTQALINQRHMNFNLDKKDYQVLQSRIQCYQQRIRQKTTQINKEKLAQSLKTKLKQFKQLLRQVIDKELLDKILMDAYLNFDIEQQRVNQRLIDFDQKVQVKLDAMSIIQENQPVLSQEKQRMRQKMINERSRFKGKREQEQQDVEVCKMHMKIQELVSALVSTLSEETKAELVRALPDDGEQLAISHDIDILDDVCNWDDSFLQCGFTDSIRNYFGL